MLTAYLDESGNDGRSPMFLFGGYVATVDQWLAFTDAWQAELDREPKLAAFHMSEAQSKKAGAWGALTAAERDERVLRFANIPTNRVLIGVLNGVPHNHVDLLMPERSRIPTEDPVYINLSLTLHVLSTNCQKDMNIVFDMPNKKAKTRMSRVIEAVMSNRGEPGFEDLNHVRGYSFADDEKCLPLQAADLLCWQWIRVLGVPNDPKLLGGWNTDALRALTNVHIYGKIAAHHSQPDPLPPSSLETEEQRRMLRRIMDGA